MIDNLLYCWDKNTGYAQRLMADVPQEKMIYQPAPGINHPAWLFSHLNLYHPVIVAVLRGQPFEDTKNHRFGMQSKPQSDASIYPSKVDLVAAYAKGHEDVAKAMRDVGEKRLEDEVPLQRWRESMHMKSIGMLLTYLMVQHESTHLGQLSVWRRVQGMPSV